MTIIWIIALLILAYGALVIQAVRTVRRSGRNMPSLLQWREIPALIGSISSAEVDEMSMHESVKDVLSQVLTNEPGYGHIDRIPSAMQPMEVAIDDHVRTYKEWAGNFVLATLVVTAVTLAAVFHSGTGDIEKEQIGKHFAVLFLANGAALLAALILQFRFLQKKAEGAEVLRAAYSALGSLKSPVTKNVEPNLAAALSHVAQEMGKWSAQQEQRNLEKIQGLTNEVRSLATSIKDLFKEVIAQRDDDSPDETAVIVSRAVQAAMEQLSARFDIAAGRLTRAVEGGIPVANALEELTARMNEKTDALLGADLSGVIGHLQQAVNQNSEVIKGLSDNVSTSILEQLSPLGNDLVLARQRVDACHKTVEELPDSLVPRMVEGLATLQEGMAGQLAAAIGAQLDRRYSTTSDSLTKVIQSLGSSTNSESSELLVHAVEISDLLKRIEYKVGQNGTNSEPDLERALERLNETLGRLDAVLRDSNDNDKKRFRFWRR